MAGGPGYDAFISYSHGHDEWLAPALQAGLQRFAKPWYRPRALRVFRDTASLSVSPQLWGSIEEALADSRWFLLLASPEAARSPWVDREVGWWLANRSPGQLLIVATAPGLHWDHAAGDWAPGAPVPPSLRGALRSEPLWLDLSQARTDARRAKIPDEQIASVAAPLRGVSRDAIFGEHVRQHRRTMRLARGVIAVLTVLTVLAVTAGVVAVNQRDTARTQARIATARLLATLSQSLAGSHLDVAQLLAVAAYQEDGDAQTRGALLQATASSPQLVRFIHVGEQVTALAASTNGQVITVGTRDGELVSFNLAAGKRASIRALSGAVSELAVSAGGQVVAATDGSSAVAWAPGTGRVQPLPRTPSPRAVAVSPSGRLIAVLGALRQSAPLLVHDLATGQDGRGQVSGIYDTLAFASESSLVLVNNPGVWERIDPASFRVLSSADVTVVPAGYDAFALSANGAYAGYVKYGTVTMTPTMGMNQLGSILTGTAGGEPASALAISPDGKQAAVDESGTIYVAPLVSPQIAGVEAAARRLTGAADTKLLAFLGTSRLATAVGEDIVWWDLTQVARIASPAGIVAPDDSNAGLAPYLLASPDGAWLEVVAGPLNTATVTALLSRPGRRPAGAGPEAVWALPVRSGDEPLLLGTTSKELVLADATGKVLRSLDGWPRSSGSPAVPAAATMLAGGSQLAVVAHNGGVYSFDLATGAVRHLVAGSGTLSACGAITSPGGDAAVVPECLGDAPATLSTRVVYDNLRTGASYLVGSEGADAVAFSGDDLLVQRHSGSLEVWDASGKRLRRTLPGIGGITDALAVSPDGSSIARLRDDGTVFLTDAATGGLLASFDLPFPANGASPDYWVQTALQFTPDGRYLITATAGGELYRWDLSAPDLVRSACATVGRALTATEWEQYVGTSPPTSLPCSG